MSKPTKNSFSKFSAQIIIMALCMTATGNNAEAAEAGKIAVKKGEKIAFLGDSITAAGKRPGGYCQLVLSALKDQGVETTAVFAGIGGH